MSASEQTLQVLPLPRMSSFVSSDLFAVHVPWIFLYSSRAGERPTEFSRDIRSSAKGCKHGGSHSVSGSQSISKYFSRGGDYLCGGSGRMRGFQADGATSGR